MANITGNPCSACELFTCKGCAIHERMTKPNSTQAPAKPLSNLVLESRLVDILTFDRCIYFEFSPSISKCKEMSPLNEHLREGTRWCVGCRIKEIMKLFGKE